MQASNALAGAVRKLAAHSRLDPPDRNAILALPHSLRTLDSGAYLVREGDLTQTCSVLVSGFACRHKITGGGHRQILAVHMAGDAVGVHEVFLEVADHNIQAISRSEIAFIPARAVRELADEMPNVARAMWTETLIDASIFREWVVNIGRRPAIGRIAHLLCELGLRMEAAGLAKAGRYELPLTQEQIADSTGLTPVHVNRVLQELGRLGLIERSKRWLTIPDPERLSGIGDFNARYLHLGRGASFELAA